MKSINKNYDCDDTCHDVISNGADVWIDKRDCEVQVDIKAERIKSTIIWGQICDFLDTPIEGVLVKLLKYVNCCGCELQTICYTHSDCNGYYQFELPQESEGRYRIMVSKGTRKKEVRESVIDCCNTCHCHNNTVPGLASKTCKYKTQNNICYY